ncbi:MAG: hypothetical protein ACYC66_15985, partial [Chloroflexota bacterium]
DGDPVRMAEAADRAYQKMHQQFGPVIGETAFRAWALRAVKLTRTRFPFLTVELAMEQGECLRGLRESVQGRDPAQAAEALTVLLANFLAVFIGLMGKNLPLTFLRDAWPEVEIGQAVRGDSCPLWLKKVDASGCRAAILHTGPPKLGPSPLTIHNSWREDVAARH